MPVLPIFRTARNDKVVDTGEPRAGKTNSRFLHSGRDDTVVGTRGEFLDGPEGVAGGKGSFDCEVRSHKRTNFCAQDDRLVGDVELHARSPSASLRAGFRLVQKRRSLRMTRWTELFP